jgi:glutamate synthase (NADPH/NADH) large chain/glutamate synthase (ferredoxin)
MLASACARRCLSKSALEAAAARGLYNPANEHDACGVGFVANISGVKSHFVMQKAINCLHNLAHRGGVDADMESGDGAGILTQIPTAIFRSEFEAVRSLEVVGGRLGVGVFFFPIDDIEEQRRLRSIVEAVLRRNSLRFIAWRDVPFEEDAVGSRAAETAPLIQHLLFSSEIWDVANCERQLFRVRKTIEHLVNKACYIPSFSSTTIVYKGMFNSVQIQQYYSDLQNPLFKTSIALFHQRYSTNTFPSWSLAHPYRMLAHNGEINTVHGNRFWAAARDRELSSDVWGQAIEDIKPTLSPGASDSAHFDSMLELVTQSGRTITEALALLVPPAFTEPSAVTEFNSFVSEAWDGPAGLVVTDGRVVCARLDRNGLRPLRYKITKSGFVFLGSEQGIGNIPHSDTVEKGRVGPGETFLVDTERNVILRDHDVKQLNSRAKHYSVWLKESVIRLPPTTLAQPGVTKAEVMKAGLRFGLDHEQLEMILKPLLLLGLESNGAMGDDAPIAALSDRPQTLYPYFRQLFAQVTNPPIDSIRERFVMDTTVTLGRRQSILMETSAHARQVQLPSPVIDDAQLAALRECPLGCTVLPVLFEAATEAGGFKAALDGLQRAAVAAVDTGKEILVLSDRGVSADNAALPMLLCVGAVHQALLQAGKRMQASIVTETGSAWNAHQIACLLAYGAAAVDPYLVWQWASVVATADAPFTKLVANYRTGLDKGLLKVTSKMGISQVSSYIGSQLFEVLGLSDAVVSQYFTGTNSPIGGASLDMIAHDCLALHRDANVFDKPSLPNFENFAYARGGGEKHVFTPELVGALRKMARSQGTYNEYVGTIAAKGICSLRDLLTLVPGRKLPLTAVEPAVSILKRLSIAAMSLGAISPESHEALARGSLAVGACSNSGEGGEDVNRLGSSANSAIKQIASGRFGVTPAYLASANEIEIKMAQGAKPGEGGQLLGVKVLPHIARLRHCLPGVMLISPPPHHDIYSIEDLAQLIYTLKRFSPRAKVGVKLGSMAGIGTIAVGVAKANADVISISGGTGGTGSASNLSIKHAGTPWECGLAEVQQALVLSDLRGRVLLRVDGGLKCGEDVVKAAALGADEFAFGTAGLMALGCRYCRGCYIGQCPVGIATQEPNLRSRFAGSAAHVSAFLTEIAEDVRRILANIGCRNLLDVIGHTEFLRQDPNHRTSKNLNLSRLLHVPEGAMELHGTMRERQDRLDSSFDQRLSRDLQRAIAERSKVSKRYAVNSNYRSIGCRVSGQIATKYGDVGLPPNTIDLTLAGSAGQALGAFMINGMRMVLVGEANDYVAEGMAGGVLIIRPNDKMIAEPSEAVIVGNVCLYGATGGKLFVYGGTGDRFGVRNSGATAVVENIGMHGCEYMTGGKIVVLGRTGKNFGSGMSGGVCFVLDEDGRWPENCNTQMVDLRKIEGAGEEKGLKDLISEYTDATGSKTGSRVLKDWASIKDKFWVVVPKKN